MINARHRLRLPRVCSGVVPSPFIALTASTASPPIRRVLGHESGACRVEEKTTLDICASWAKPSSSWLSVANPDISR